ncbi:MAG: hypothetical protein AWU57_361 [Marinobacter sp. T13-3]|nr:MAG: hypothetical protein AWU57_361 [Marinobacter sp. T13-3]
MATISLDTIIKYKISLLSPPEGSKRWCAQVWMFENNFIVENEDPQVAAQVCLNELIEHGMADSDLKDTSVGRRFNQFDDDDVLEPGPSLG